jgi:epoxyqueuosine reductase
VEQIKERLIQYGKNLGFDLVGITTAEPLRAAQAEINRRIKAGIYSSLASGNPEERITPALLLPGVRSVIMVAMSYSVDPKLHAKGPKDNITENLATPYRGLLSRYAWGHDYHHVMLPRLSQLAEFIERSIPGTHCRIMVDSGPLLEKAMAHRAGLGFFGWNSCLITDEFGSWVFLGSLLTTASLPPDPFQARTCRECGRCIKACPTGAIVAPYVIDPHLCLSHITQARGIMPEKFRKLLGNRLFGCDTCQVVCPHNATASWGNHREFLPHPLIGSNPSLEMVLGLTNRSFQTTFGQTAAGWRGKNILQRNALINLGNIGDTDAVPLLTKALEDPSKPKRIAADWALSTIQAK